MPDAGRESLEGLIERVCFRYSFEVDFTSTDPESLPEIVRRLRDAALVFNLLAITEFGGRSGKEREEGLPEEIIGSAFQTFDGEDLYPDPGPIRRGRGC